MKSTYLLGVLIILVVILLLIFSWRGRPVSHYYIPDGYNKRVNRLIGDGKLYLTPDKSIAKKSLSGEEEEFYYLSYLSDDVRRANDNENELKLRFEFRHNRQGNISRLTGIQRNIHSRLFGPISWHGYIFYRKPQSQVAILKSNKSVFVIRRRPNITLLPNNAIPKVTKSEDVLATSSVTSKDTINYTLILNLKLPSRYRREHVASIYYYGLEDLVLDVSAAGIRSEDRIWLNNQLLYTGQRMKLKNNDFIKIGTGKSKEEFRVNLFNPKVEEVSEDFGTIAAPSFINGHLQSKIYDESIPFIPVLVNVLDAVVKNSPDDETKREAEKTEVHLSIDMILNRVIQDLLNRCFKKPKKHLGYDLGRSGYTNASVTLMDIKTGEVLAIATYNQNKNRKTDHNFRSHALGSAFKVFLAAAALKTNPRAYTFKMTGKKERDVVLGYKLYSPFSDHVAGEIDFDKFLSHSSNHYAFALLLMALSGKDNRGIIQTTEQSCEAYWFNGQKYERSPDFTHYLSRYKSPNFIERSEFAKHLQHMFAIDREFKAKDFIVHETAVWGGLKDSIPKSDKFIEYQLRKVSPERSFMPLNVIRDRDDVRLELVPFSLGDWENKWTNIKAAEALSRVVTNRKVWATFIEGYQRESKDSEPLLPEREHQRLLKAMEKVISPVGTAKEMGKKLNQLKKKGLKSSIRVYSKTGTANPNEAMKRRRLPAHKGFYMFAMVDTASETPDGIAACVYFENFSLRGLKSGSFYPVYFSARLLIEEIAKYKGWLL
jgi:hypothetical protein